MQIIDTTDKSNRRINQNFYANEIKQICDSERNLTKQFSLIFSLIFNVTYSRQSYSWLKTLQNIFLKLLNFWLFAVLISAYKNCEKTVKKSNDTEYHNYSDHLLNDTWGLSSFVLGFNEWLQKKFLLAVPALTCTEPVQYSHYCCKAAAAQSEGRNPHLTRDTSARVGCNENFTFFLTQE